MKVSLIRQFGGPERFEIADVARPNPGPGEVLVRIAAASVNPVDYKIRAVGPSIAPELPAVLGCDLSGTVEAIGPNVSTFAAGDTVYGCAGGVRGMGGTYSEYIATDARLLAHKPASLSFAEAAALPLVTITAWEGLDRAGVTSRDRILVLGGTGGVGHVAVQLAKARGAHVTATVSSEEKARIAKGLGADEIVNYRSETLARAKQRLTGGKGFDVVFDTTGRDNFAACFDAVKETGQVVTIVSQYTVDLSPMHYKGLSLHHVFMLIPMLSNIGREAHGAILTQAAALADHGRLKPLIDSRFPLTEVGQAHARLEDGSATGKIVIDIAQEA
jgi:NADPH2:quinone reductase